MKSTPLKTLITSDMPNLQVQMIPRNSPSSAKLPMLQGQVTEWSLRITNQGNAPAQNIILKTNVPWINILQNEEKDSLISTSSCLGPSGTLMQIPLKGDELLENNFLKPGQSNDIPIQIRTSGGGKQDFYMLLRYEKSQEPSDKSAPKVRWLRNMVSVAVYPSLTVAASLIPSYNDNNDYVLSLEVSRTISKILFVKQETNQNRQFFFTQMTNYRSDKKNEKDLNICIDTITVASKTFKIKPFMEDVRESRQRKGHPIGWREQISLHYLISPNTLNLPADVTSYVALTSATDNNQMNKISTTDFACLEHAYEKFKV